MTHPIYARYDKPIVMIGFGSIGRGSLPLILRHIDSPRDKFVIISPDDYGRRIAESENIGFKKLALTRDNYRAILTPLLSGGGFLVNVSVEVSSIDLTELCRELGALYIDTCIEPWPGGYTDPKKSLPQRSNYALREEALSHRQPGSTAVLAHGANPGLVSHLIKRAMTLLAKDLHHPTAMPTSGEGWATLSRDMGIKGVHIAERCHYAYHPCNDAILSLHELQGNPYRQQSKFRPMNEEIVDGTDELGVLLYGHAKNAFWYGSQLSIHEARRLAPYQNATALQVTSAVVAGMAWAIAHPQMGIVEAEEMDHEFILNLMKPYLGTLAGNYTSWTPLEERGDLFPEDLDCADAWQFKNVIVR